MPHQHFPFISISIFFLCFHSFQSTSSAQTTKPREVRFKPNSPNNLEGIQMIPPNVSVIVVAETKDSSYFENTLLSILDSFQETNISFQMIISLPHPNDRFNEESDCKKVKMFQKHIYSVLNRLVQLSRFGRDEIILIDDIQDDCYQNIVKAAFVPDETPSNSLQCDPSSSSEKSLCQKSEWLQTVEKLFTGEHLLWLSSRIILTPNALREMIQPLVHSPLSLKVGVTSPLLINEFGEIFSAGIDLYFARLGYLSEKSQMAPFPSHRYSGAPENLWRVKVGEEIAGVSKHAMMMRRKVYEAVGGFRDIHLFPSFHDIDLCLRIREYLLSDHHSISLPHAPNELESQDNNQAIKLVHIPTIIWGEKERDECTSADQFSQDQVHHYLELTGDLARNYVLSSFQKQECLIKQPERYEHRYLSNVTVVWSMECDVGQVRGFSNEAISYVIELEKLLSIYVDVANPSACQKLLEEHPLYVKCAINRLMNKPLDRQIPEPSVVVIHKSPGRYAGSPGYKFSQLNPLAVIGRSMYETDRLPKEWASQIQDRGVTQVWVPSSFNVYTFWISGVDAKTLSVLPEGVDADFFDRNIPRFSFRPSFLFQYHRALSLREEGQEHGDQDWEKIKDQREERDFKEELEERYKCGVENDDEEETFFFLSIFKFEDRKGWRQLLNAFYSEFDRKKDNVALVILSHMDETNHRDLEEFGRRFVGGFLDQDGSDREKREEGFGSSEISTEAPPSLEQMKQQLNQHYQKHWVDEREWEPGDWQEKYFFDDWDPYFSGERFSRDSARQVDEQDINQNDEEVQGDNSGAESQENGEWKEKLPVVLLLTEPLSSSSLAALYASVDAFVLPTRGEGWGRPLIEAMAMRLPVIATNWSGLTEFMTPHNSILIPVKEFVEVEGNRGHFWATASVPHLREKMRELYCNRTLGNELGEQARVDIETKFSQRAVSLLALKKIEDLVMNFTQSTPGDSFESESQEPQDNSAHQQPQRRLEHSIKIKNDHIIPDLPDGVPGQFPPPVLL